MVSTGWMTAGKTVIYPFARPRRKSGLPPLINWVAEIEAAGRCARTGPAAAGSPT